jgi:FlaA1/EpsC-like NDP-sugar epimerase
MSTQRLRRFRLMLKVAYDLGSWMAAAVLATMLRYVPGTAPWRVAVAVGLALCVTYLVLVGLVRVAKGRATTGSIDDVLEVGSIAVIAGAIVSCANADKMFIARSVPIAATVGFLAMATFGRLLWRSFVERGYPAMDGVQTASRVLVVGAGEAGRELVTSMVRDPRREWVPVGLVDDDRTKRHLRIRGVAVVGDTSGIPDLVERTRADTVVVAIPSASSETVTRIADSGRAAGADVKVLPSTSELLRGHVGIRDIRDINLADVLGRKQVDTDVASIAGYLSGRRVLVTGAGGSIGSELCRQISRFGPSELIMLDRDESALHALQLSLTGRAMLDGRDVVLCDIRDQAALRQVFLSRRPEVVFHTAALKHLPMLEQYPVEAVKTNVMGTENVLRAADEVDVVRLVNISTDKAANPCSVLGHSKRVAERLTAAYAQRASGAFLSVRFGNVLGSRGSVLTAFARQIAQGGPVTVTHPDVTRYFMTISEACQLVVQAGAIGRPGEALVLDMGQPVKILEVAEHLISRHPGRIEVEFTGLRDGEKLHEDLFGATEPQDVRPWHPLVSHVPVEPVANDLVSGLPTKGRREDVVVALELVSTGSEHRPGYTVWTREMEENLFHVDD